MDFIAYYRVSTAKQGRSGLGLDAQKRVVREFAETRGNLIFEYVEIESGSNAERPELKKAIDQAKSIGAVLVVARLDRFSRSVSFISGLMDQGIGFQVAEMPNASDFQLHIHAACAQEERRLISVRTKAALQQAKERGVVLGKNGTTLAKENKRLAREFALSLKPTIDEMLGSGRTFSGIALLLNQRGLKSFRNKKFYPSTVQNMVRVLDDRQLMPCD
jgi:DNA invertase Pin-like site-specific DNA recombinase